MRQGITTTFFLLLTLYANSQIIDASICTATTQPIITSQVQYIKTTDSLSLQNVLQPSVQQTFQRFPNKSLVFIGYDPYYYWFRFIIRNTDTTPKNLYLLMGHIGQDNAILYQSNLGRWDTLGKTGNQYNFAQRAYPSIHTVYPLQVHAQSVDTFYMYMDYGHNYKTFGFALINARRLHYVETQTYFGFGLMTGVLLLFAFFNLYLLFWLNEKIHLWYCLYIVWLVFLLFKYEGFDEQFFPLDNETANRLTPVMAVGAITIFLLLQLVQQFLSNIRPPSWLYRLTQLVKYNMLLSAAVHTVCFYFQLGLKPESLSFEYANKSTVAGIFFILINCIVSYRKKFKPALFILCGTGVFLLGGLEKILFVDEPSYIFPPSLFEVGMVVEAGIISFGLMYRYNLYRKEKTQMARLLQDERRNISEKVMDAQQAEQRRIAEDLHDEIGGDLAAIKAGLQNGTLHSVSKTDVLGMLDKTAQKVRKIAHNLMPPDFDHQQLVVILDDYFILVNTEGSIQFQFLVTGTPRNVDKRTEIVLYRIVMELTNNILKHAEATEATVQLFYNPEAIELTVEDNGIGLPTDVKEGLGLRNVRSRVQYLRGILNVDSNETGTFIFIQIPYTHEFYEDDPHRIN